MLFLGSEVLADNYPYIHVALSMIQRGWLTIIHIHTVLFLGSDVLSDNYPYIHGAISRSRGVG